MYIHSFAELWASTHTCTRWPPSWQENPAPHSPRRTARRNKCQSWEQSHQTVRAWEQRWTPRQTGTQAPGRSGLEGSCPPPAGKCTQPLTWWWACPAQRTPGLLWRVGKREKLECCRTGSLLEHVIGKYWLWHTEKSHNGFQGTSLLEIRFCPAGRKQNKNVKSGISVLWCPADFKLKLWLFVCNG